MRTWWVRDLPVHSSHKRQSDNNEKNTIIANTRHNKAERLITTVAPIVPEKNFHSSPRLRMHYGTISQIIHQSRDGVLAACA